MPERITSLVTAEEVERRLLQTRGVKIEISRDSPGWLKVRILWDAFIVFEAAIVDDDWRAVLIYALRYIEHRSEQGA